MGIFTITRRSNGEYQFSLSAANGQKILLSEGYTTKQSCINGIESVKYNGNNDTRFDRKTSTNGKYYSNLKAQNGQIIGTSELYESIAARENGIYSVQKNSQSSEVVDLT